MRKFAAEQKIHNYDINEGVCHQVVVEKGRAAPGEIVVGADSHTCMYGAVGAFATGIGSTDMGFVLKFGALYFKVPETIRAEVSGKFQKRVGAKDLILSIASDIGADGATYKAIEFTGKTVAELDMAGRMTCCNMAIEMGAKAGIVAPDKITWKYMKERRAMKPFSLESDADAVYADKRSYDVSDLEPQVAIPHNVDTGVPVGRVAGTPVDQVFIGSCTNGRFEDFQEAAEVLGKKKFSPRVRVIIIPASRDEYLKTLQAGLIEKFVRAGGLVEAPCCGPCMGGAFGLLAPGEVSLSTSNRNFRGRQGSTEGKGIPLFTGNCRSKCDQRGNNRSEGGLTMRTWKFGDNIDTDAIIPGRFLTIYDPKELARHAFEGIRDEFSQRSQRRGYNSRRAEFWLWLFPRTRPPCPHRCRCEGCRSAILCKDILPECD